MGYNYAGAFEGEPNIPEPNTSEEVELQVSEYPLVAERALAFFKKLESQLQNEVFEVRQFITLKVAEVFYTKQLKNVSDHLDYLLEQGEELIESKDANTPEVLAQRKALAEKVNTFFDVKDTYVEKLDKVKSDLVTASFLTKEQENRVRELSGPALDGINQVLSLPEDLN